jgi:hypothetical protein
MSMVNMAAYNSSVLVWLGYSALKSPVREASQTLLRPQRWEQSLSDAHHPLPADSLIPMFEGMVDRALSRTQPDSSLAREPRPASGMPWDPDPSPVANVRAAAARAASKT